MAVPRAQCWLQDVFISGTWNRRIKLVYFHDEPRTKVRVIKSEFQRAESYNFCQTDVCGDKIENTQFQIEPWELYELYLKFTPRLNYEQGL